MELGTSIVFYVLAAVIVASAIFAVTAKRIMRAATCLLFVLVGTAGLYLLLNYHFLAAVQLSVYAGGVLILFIFAILLTNPKGDPAEPADRQKVVMGIVAALCGLAVTAVIVLKHFALYPIHPSAVGEQEINMQAIGAALMGTGKQQYLLPFELLSVLLLACIIGGILIARKGKGQVGEAEE
ncbi:MAG: NADH-quinone oxidoreductase subunit J [Prevotellaceae bacterium]|jgi:NADH-quinone oxidoreductase subunit J|nr:NADH-quinone oxidoreductase subunit J [Prevotellaceae bacterium]